MLVCDFVPELGVFNAAVLGDEHRVETEFLLLFKVLEQSCNGLDQEQKTQQVESCDKTAADVGDESGAKAREDSVDCRLGVAGAGLNAGKGLHKCVARAVNDIVAAGAEDHQTGGGADDERVDANGERLSETLLDGVRDLSRRGGLRAGTLTGFGRVDTALYAPHDGRAEDCTERSFLIEGTAEDEAEHGGNSRDICPQNDDHQHNIHTGHERNDVAGERADALAAPSSA